MSTTPHAGTSGIGRQTNDPRPGGSASGAIRHESAVDGRQAVEATEGEDDLAAASEAEMRREAARSTPPMGDVRSDAGAGAGEQNGEPL